MTAWRKSSYCGPSSGCVEVGPLPVVVADDGSPAGVEVIHRVGVRDSTDPAGPVLVLGRDQFGRMLTTIKEADDG